MTVIVKELIIRASVIDNSSAQMLSPEARYIREEERMSIISDCVEQVLEIIEQEKER